MVDLYSGQQGRRVNDARRVCGHRDQSDHAVAIVRIGIVVAIIVVVGGIEGRVDRTRSDPMRCVRIIGRRRAAKPERVGPKWRPRLRIRENHVIHQVSVSGVVRGCCGG